MWYYCRILIRGVSIILSDNIHYVCKYDLVKKLKGHKVIFTLQRLSLVECTRITNDGLNSEAANLTNLSVPGCTRLNVECIMNILKDFKFTGTHGVKCLCIGGLHGVTREHFEEWTSRPWC
ncbi:hypothetical protein K1719_036065 [Acacia pycnantha]|nr:hypothetical protein K1719_036065 [Acacia pycnantha]